MRVLFFISALMLSLQGRAEDVCRLPERCATNGWQVAVAIGVGARSNPLDGGDRIPLVLLPDIAWYGETMYFDNGEFGAQWLPSEADAVDFFLGVNKERAYFSFWHPQNIFFERLYFGMGATENDQISNESLALNIENISERRWSVDAGMRWHHYWAASEWQIAWLTDASKVHNGQQVQIRFQHQWPLQHGAFSVAIGTTWKSNHLVDYYYGIDERDHVAPELYYRGYAGWQPELALSYTRAIDERWQWLARAGIVKLNRGMSDSPIVSDQRVSSYFAGASYQF